MELDFIDWLTGRLPTSPQLRVGVGDDAALVALQRPELVATADLLIDGVHFLTGEHTPERIGHKSLAVNLSDLAAMAARPAGALVSLALPRDGACGLPPRELAARLIEGMLPLAEQFGCPIVGGDTNVGSGPLVISVTAFGEPTDRGVVRRDGAKQGDWLMVTGEGLGGSLAGKHLDFTPRVAEALDLASRFDLHAMMDLSDGLALDARRLGEASGVGIVVFEDHLPVSEAAKACAQDSGRSPIEHALTDGEDFELLIAVEPEVGRGMLARPPRSGTLWIGEVTEHGGVNLRNTNGSVEPLTATGYEHR